MRHGTVRCKQCQSEVKDDWSAKWKHVVNVHPEIVANHLLPMIANPIEAQAFGEALGNWIVSKVRL